MNGLLCVVYNVHVAKRWDPLCQLSRVWSDTTLALSCPELPFTCSSRKLKNKYSMACLQQATNAFGNLKIETLKQKFMNWKVHVLYARFFFHFDMIMLRWILLWHSTYFIWFLLDPLCYDLVTLLITPVWCCASVFT